MNWPLPAVVLPLLFLPAPSDTSAMPRERLTSATSPMQDPPPWRAGVDAWSIDPAFREDVFTFVRLRYGVDPGLRRGWRGYRSWEVDYPDSDLNFSFRLQQLTSMKVDPNGVVLDITDPELFDYPWAYMIEPGALLFDEDEVKALRHWLLNGGFLMVDDFWGDEEYDNFYSQIKRVFPDRDVIDVPLSHEIFHMVYDLKRKPQIPSIQVARRGRYDGVTWEYRPGTPTDTPNYRAILDDEERIMVFICHNTDTGDGWEREGENEWYFEEFSVKQAYPLGINIVTYALTH